MTLRSWLQRVVHAAGFRVVLVVVAPDGLDRERPGAERDLSYVARALVAALACLACRVVPPGVDERVGLRLVVLVSFDDAHAIEDAARRPVPAAAGAGVGHVGQVRVRDPRSAVTRLRVVGAPSRGGGGPGDEAPRIVSARDRDDVL